MVAETSEDDGKVEGAVSGRVVEVKDSRERVE